MTRMELLEGLRYFAPECVISGLILVLILADLVPAIRKSHLRWIAALGLAATLVTLIRWLQIHPQTPVALFLGAYAYDPYAQFFKVAFVAATLMVVLFSEPVIAKWGSGRGEYYTLVLSCGLGMMLMASANDLLMMYLSLEFVSVTSYIMAGLLRKNRQSAEASLKYIIYGAGASGMMLFGFSLLYGLTGTLNVVQIGKVLSTLPLLQDPHQLLPLIMSSLIMAGFGYKIAAVPFHMWCPDVYQGAPTPITAFFSVGPKAAGFAMLVRFFYGLFPPGSRPAFEWQLVLAILSVLTMAVGNLAALHQQNLKRLLAYSSIAHSGYMLLAFVVFAPENIASIMFYIAIYLIMNLGAFLVVLVLEECYGVMTVDDCRGLGWRAPGLCVLMAIFLFSLTGIPPFAGFIGKLLVFGYVVKGGMLGMALVVVAVLFSVISLYYYARVVGAMFLFGPEEGRGGTPVPHVMSAILWLLGIATVFFGLGWERLYLLAEHSARNILSGI